MSYIADKRLYVNSDQSKVVDEGSPEAAYLLVGEGGELTDEDAKKYGLKAQPKAEDKAEHAPAENKSEPSPATERK